MPSHVVRLRLKLWTKALQLPFRPLWNAMPWIGPLPKTNQKRTHSVKDACTHNMPLGCFQPFARTTFNLHVAAEKLFPRAAIFPEGVRLLIHERTHDAPCDPKVYSQIEYVHPAPSQGRWIPFRQAEEVAILLCDRRLAASQGMRSYRRALGQEAVHSHT